MNRAGLPRKSGASLTHSRRAKDPWLHSTSLNMSSKLAKQAVSIYRTRMQIEEEFRDRKSRLHGFGFEHNRSKLFSRLDVLILMSTLACRVTILIGLIVVSTDQHKHYQVNTVKNRRVLFIQYQGRSEVKNARIKLLKQHLINAIDKIKRTIQMACACVE